MKKLIVLIFVLGLANAASAVIYYEPQVGGSNDDVTAEPGDIIYFDIYATGAADYLTSTGELLVTITGDATITDLFNLVYPFPIDPPIIALVFLDDDKNARVGFGTDSPMIIYWMPIPGYPIGNIGITYGGTGTATVTIVPNNNPNPWGNTRYVKDGIAYVDLEATGGSINIIPEPATIVLVGLGGLALLRRRRK